MLRLALAAMLGVAATGCGLIDSNITDFDLSVPNKTFSVDTAQWDLTSDSEMPAIACSGMPGVCSAGISQACGAEFCFGSCDGTNCKALIAVSLFTPINLYDEKPELQTIDDQPLVTVTVNRVAYDVTENTLSIDTPELTVYVAPANAVTTGDPQARAIGTVASIPAMTQLTDAEVNLTPEGRDTLRQYMKDYKTPFNILVGTSVELSAGDPIPAGKLTVVVRVAASAGI
jgi:hypothetical protein